MHLSHALYTFMVDADPLVCSCYFARVLGFSLELYFKYRLIIFIYKLIRHRNPDQLFSRITLARSAQPQHIFLAQTRGSLMNRCFNASTFYAYHMSSIQIVCWFVYPIEYCQLNNGSVRNFFQISYYDIGFS